MSVKLIEYRTPIHATFSVRKISGPRVGIELEYEGAKVNRVRIPDLSSYWHMDMDHSLRLGGLEFVSSPLAPSSIQPALRALEPQLAACGASVTKRCGMHGHLNVSDLNFMQLWQIATMYTLVEPFIFKNYADGREDSHFCVPMWANSALQHKAYKDATLLYRGVSTGKSKVKAVHPFLSAPIDLEGILDEAGPLVTNGKVPLEIMKNAKYSSMNFTSLSKFGTLEFRMARSTLDMAEVSRFCRLLFRLRREALRFSSAENILDKFDREGLKSITDALRIVQRPDVNPEYIQDAVDAATIMVGHAPTDFNDLEWEIT